MQQSTISIDVKLGDDKLPEEINWQVNGGTVSPVQPAKAMLLFLLDSRNKQTLQLDLYTKNIMLDEMADFIFQVYKQLAKTFDRATNEVLADTPENAKRQKELVASMMKFAELFNTKYLEFQ